MVSNVNTNFEYVHSQKGLNSVINPLPRDVDKKTHNVAFNVLIKFPTLLVWNTLKMAVVMIVNYYSLRPFIMVALFVNAFIIVFAPFRVLYETFANYNFNTDTYLVFDGIAETWRAAFTPLYAVAGQYDVYNPVVEPLDVVNTQQEINTVENTVSSDDTKTEEAKASLIKLAGKVTFVVAKHSVKFPTLLTWNAIKMTAVLIYNAVSTLYTVALCVSMVAFFAIVAIPHVLYDTFSNFEFNIECHMLAQKVFANQSDRFILSRVPRLFNSGEDRVRKLSLKHATWE